MWNYYNDYTPYTMTAKDRFQMNEIMNSALDEKSINE